MYDLARVIWQILPVVLGVMASPVAVLALLGIMLSDRPVRNSVCFSAGWALAVSCLFGGWLAALHATGAAGPAGDGSILRVLHLLVAVCCLGGAVWTFRRSRRALERLAAARTPGELADAAPQLPGLMRSTEHYTALRAFVLGAGVFVLNPMNVSLVAATAIDVLAAEVTVAARVLLAAGFVLAASLPVLIPTALLLFGGHRAERPLRRLRRWVLHNNGFLRAGLLLIVGFMQLERALTGVIL